MAQNPPDNIATLKQEIARLETILGGTQKVEPFVSDSWQVIMDREKAENKNDH